MSKKIIFHSNRLYCKDNDGLQPEPAGKMIPDWFQKQDLYFKNPITNQDYTDAQGFKAPTFKACPGILDLFTAGYIFKTPCDLEFYQKDNRIKVKVPSGYEGFCGEREQMPGFPTPTGYEDKHFHWWSNWAPELPEGYSALYLTPMNRYDLPFTNTTGIIDNDKFSTPGLLPFFLKKGWTGTIPAGTPYLQIIPFKRENWDSEYIIHDMKQIQERHAWTVKTFRTKDGGVYKKLFWSRRKYK